MMDISTSQAGVPVGRRVLVLVVIGLALATFAGCFRLRSSAGGGQTSFTPPRLIRAQDVALPAGYQLEPVVSGLTFPTGVTFDEAGRIYLIEAGYSYGEVWTTPRLLRVEDDGRLTTVASGGRNGPWTGVLYHRGAFYIAEGGELDGGRILRMTPDGAVTALISNLPSRGDHHTNGPAVGPDGRLYIGVGTYTNAGVVGEDNAAFGWLKRYPDLHDLPCRDITLRGVNFTTANPLVPDAGARVETGAFSPFGTSTTPGQVIRGQVPCSGAILRLPPEGGTPELVAWGFRNPFGLAFAPDGRLFVTDNSYDDRGSRPVHGAGDLLWAVMPGTWYGWPDFHGSRRLDDGDHYQSPGKPRPPVLLAAYPSLPPKPAAIFGVHSSSTGFDFSRDAAFGFVGQAFVAQFGDQAPVSGKALAPVGFKVVRVDVTTGLIEDFAVNKGPLNGPASRIGGGGLERPVAARFDPRGEVLYIVDFGVMTMGQRSEPRTDTGVLWRLRRAAVARR
jgi:glucose/arabinose dehydrogenase